MVTYKTKKNHQGNYLTADTKTGEKVLRYFHKMCEKTLDYCQQQGLTTLEDFAEALESISEEDNPKLKIAVEVNNGGIALKLAEQPSLGSTTGKYMMQHLDFDEDEQTKFTRAGIEAALQPQKKASRSRKSEDILDLLDDDNDLESSAPKTGKKVKQTLLDDLLDDTLETESQTPTSAPKKTALDYDQLLDQAAGISQIAATQGQEIDGINLNGLGAQIGILAAVVGIEQAKRIMEAAQEAGKTKQITKIAQRLKAAYDRTDELIKRSEELDDLLLESQSNSEILETEQNNTETNPNQILADAVSQLDQRLDSLDQDQPKQPAFKLNQQASFDQQLKQINQALERIESRLDALEARIEALETALKQDTELNPINQAKTQVQEIVNSQTIETEDFGVDEPNLTSKATIYFDGGSRGNPGIAAGAAVIIMDNGETHTVSQFLEEATNNQAEYTGLIVGLKKAQELGCTELDIKGDSQLIIKQMEGDNQVKSTSLKPLYREAQALLTEFDNVDFTWIERSENQLADQAVNDCLDSQIKTPQSSNLAVNCADTLLKVYQVCEQNGDSVNDGIVLGDSAILYAIKAKNSITLSIETMEGEELFAAQNKQGKWSILTDHLSDSDKRQIQSLENVETDIEEDDDFEVKPQKKTRQQIEV
jgi:ribonuclease HI